MAEVQREVDGGLLGMDGGMRMWKRRECGCVKADLPRLGRIMIRCKRHRGKPTKKRLLCHFEEGMVRRGI